MIVTLFFIAGYEDMVSLLLEFGADVNCRNADGMTPLMFACQRGCSEVARTLVQHCAEVNAIDNNDKSALIYAAEHGHLEIVELLVACDWHTQSNELGLIEAAQQATVVAASKGHIQVIAIGPLTIDTPKRVVSKNIRAVYFDFFRNRAASNLVFTHFYDE